MSRINSVAAAGFGRAADLYERARPSYPVEAVEWFLARAGLGPESTIVDVAAGTGKLTRLLDRSGARVIAVEPVPEMRAKISDVDVVDGTAEELPFADGAADAITVAQALHWFDLDRALPELHRVLRPGGWLAVFWNMRDLTDPVQRAVDDLLAPMREGVLGQLDRVWEGTLHASSLFGPVETRRFRNEQSFTTEDLCDRVASTSFVATMSQADRDGVLQSVRGLTHGVAEPFAFPYETEVQLLPRSSDRGDSERGTSIKG